MDLRLTQRQVAERLAVNPWTLLNWELSRTRPRQHSLPRILAFLSQGWPEGRVEAAAPFRPA